MSTMLPHHQRPWRQVTVTPTPLDNLATRVLPVSWLDETLLLSQKFRMHSAISVTTIQHFPVCRITSQALLPSCLACDIITQLPECAGSWRLVSRVSIYVGTNPLVSQVLNSPGLHAQASRVDFAWGLCSIASHDPAGHFRCVALLATSDPMQPGGGRHSDGKVTEPAVSPL